MKFKEGALPIDAKERLKYLYRFQEMLRLFHNSEGTKYKNKEMTESKFRSFQKDWFRKRNNLISSEINRCKLQIPKIETARELTTDERCSIMQEYKAAKKDEKIIINIEDIEE